MNTVSYSIARVCLVCCFLYSTFQLSAQNNNLFVPSEGTEVLSSPAEFGFYAIREDLQLNIQNIFTDHANVFGLNEFDEMRVWKINEDSMGNVHTKFTQWYKGIPVEFTMLIVHARANGTVYMVNGNIIRELNLPNQPLVSEASALATALQHVPATTYLWEDPQLEQHKKDTEQNRDATYFPKGILCIYPTTRNPDLLTEDFSLGWRFDIYVKEGGESTKVYVDALNGRIGSTEKLGHVCTSGTATTTFNGNQTISTFWNGSNYQLLNNCQVTTLRTYDAINDTSANQATEFLDANNVWNFTTQWSPTQTQYGVERTYIYYSTIHNRFSWNGDSWPMVAYHGIIGLSYANACWGCWGDVAVFGIGPTTLHSDDWNTLDIVGHEFTHGVVQDEIDSYYGWEPGALNESFADIFGEMTEQTAEGSTELTAEWLVGEDRGAPLRSFGNPDSLGYPDTYEGENWVNVFGCTPDTTNDQCGVHTNSSVQNYWFYMLAHGDSGTNDNNNYYSVNGIGNVKARKIAYGNLVNYMTPTGGFLQSRNGSIQAAEDLYGVCSNEAIQTAKAWSAAGADVDHAQYSPFYNCFTITSPSSELFYQGIRSLRFSHTVCGLSSITATNYNINLLAGDYVSLKHDSYYTATGTAAIIMRPNNCSTTIH